MSDEKMVRDPGPIREIPGPPADTDPLATANFGSQFVNRLRLEAAPPMIRVIFGEQFANGEILAKESIVMSLADFNKFLAHGAQLMGMIRTQQENASGIIQKG